MCINISFFMMHINVLRLKNVYQALQFVSWYLYWETIKSVIWFNIYKTWEEKCVRVNCPCSIASILLLWIAACWVFVAWAGPTQLRAPSQLLTSSPLYEDFCTIIVVGSQTNYCFCKDSLIFEDKNIFIAVRNNQSRPNKTEYFTNIITTESKISNNISTNWKV